MQSAWDKPVRSNDALRSLHTNLSRTAAALEKWDKDRRAHNNLTFNIANEIWLSSKLSEAEWDLSRFIKARLLCIDDVYLAHCRQRSRLTKIRVADANCKFFLHKANGRRRKNFISKLVSPSGEVSDHGDKATLILTTSTPCLELLLPQRSG